MIMAHLSPLTDFGEATSAPAPKASGKDDRRRWRRRSLPPFNGFLINVFRGRSKVPPTPIGKTCAHAHRRRPLPTVFDGWMASNVEEIQQQRKEEKKKRRRKGKERETLECHQFISPVRRRFWLLGSRGFRDLPDLPGGLRTTAASTRHSLVARIPRLLLDCDPNARSASE